MLSVLLLIHGISNGQCIFVLLRVSSDNSPFGYLQVVKGDIFSEDDLTEHFRGADTVVSCLGFEKTTVVTGYTDSMKHIVSAMKAANVQRLVVMTAYYSDSTYTFIFMAVVSYLFLCFGCFFCT